MNLRQLVPFSLLLLPSLTGCAGFWDEVTSRDFRFASLYTRDEPLVVLRESTDGNRRAKALQALREPKQNGGTEADQDVVVKLLVTSATSDKQPLCRLAAVRSLGHFQDPRAAQGLMDAFYNANSFAPDTATVLRCEALTALGETGNPVGLDLLARVVKEPQAEGTEQEKQQALDVRVAAARALRHYQQPQATEALVRIMRTEKNVALKDRAHESLEASTGRLLAADDPAWDEFLKPENNRNLPPEASPVRRVLHLMTP